MSWRFERTWRVGRDRCAVAKFSKPNVQKDYGNIDKRRIDLYRLIRFVDDDRAAGGIFEREHADGTTQPLDCQRRQLLQEDDDASSDSMVIAFDRFVCLPMRRLSNFRTRKQVSNTTTNTRARQTGGTGINRGAHNADERTSQPSELRARVRAASGD